MVYVSKRTGASIDQQLDKVDLKADTTTVNTALAGKQPIGSATIASATVTDIGTLTASSITITGNVTITSLGNAKPGTAKTLYFTGTPTIQNNASIVLPDGVNFVARVGDVLQVSAYGTDISTIWRAVVSPGSVRVASGDPTLTIATGIADNSALMKVGNDLVQGPTVAEIASAETYATAAQTAQGLAEDARDEAVLYGGVQVNDAAELDALTVELTPVGTIVIVKGTGSFEVVASGGDFTTTGGVQFLDRSKRTAANLAWFASFPDGTIGVFDGLIYQVSSGSTGANSDTYDLGVDGVISAIDDKITKFGAVPDGVFDVGPIINRMIEKYSSISINNFTRDYVDGGRIVFQAVPGKEIAVYRIATPIVLLTDNVEITCETGAIILDDCDGPWLTVGSYEESWPSNVKIDVDCRKNTKGLCIDIVGAVNSYFKIEVSGTSSVRSTNVVNGVRFGQLQACELNLVRTENVNGYGAKFMRTSANEGHLTVGTLDLVSNGGEWAELQYRDKISEATPGDTITGATSGATAIVVDHVAYTPFSTGVASSTVGAYAIDHKTGDFVDGENLQVSGVTIAVCQNDKTTYVPIIDFASLVFEADETANTSGISGMPVQLMDCRHFPIRATSPFKVSTAYAVGDEVIPSTVTERAAIRPMYAICEVAGTSDTVQPTWPTDEDQTFVSGGATFRTYFRPNHEAVSIYGRSSSNPTELNSSSEVVCFSVVSAFFENTVGPWVRAYKANPKLDFAQVVTFGGGVASYGGGFSNGGLFNSAYLSIGSLYDNSPNVTTDGELSAIMNWKGTVDFGLYRHSGRTSEAAFPLGINRTAMTSRTRSFAGFSLDYILDEISPQSLEPHEMGVAYSVGDIVRASGLERVTQSGGSGTLLVDEIVKSDDEQVIGVVRVAAAPIIWIEYLPQTLRRFAVADNMNGVESGAIRPVGNIGLRYTKAYLECSVAGTTDASTEPLWGSNPTDGDTVTDGTVTWTYRLYGDGFVPSEGTSVTISHDIGIAPLSQNRSNTKTAVSASWPTGIYEGTIDASTFVINFSDKAPLGIGGMISGVLSCAG